MGSSDLASLPEVEYGTFVLRFLTISNFQPIQALSARKDAGIASKSGWRHTSGMPPEGGLDTKRLLSLAFRGTRGAESPGRQWPPPPRVRSVCQRKE